MPDSKPSTTDWEDGNGRSAYSTCAVPEQEDKHRQANQPHKKAFLRIQSRSKPIFIWYSI